MLNPKCSISFHATFHTLSRCKILTPIRKLILYILPLSFLSLNYNIDFNDVVGLYNYKCRLLEHTELELKRDSTFNYYWYRLGFVSHSSQTYGKWKINGNKIILNSDLNDTLAKKHMYNFQESIQEKKDSITFEFIDIKNKPVESIICYLKKGRDTIDRGSTNNLGLFNFEKNDADSLITLHPYFNTIKHPLSKKSNHYKFIIKKDEGFITTKMIDYTLTYKNKKLIDENLITAQKKCKEFYLK